MVHFGFYQSPSQYAYQDLIRDTWIDQVAHGMTTAAINSNNGVLFGGGDGGVGPARYVEGLLDIGLISTDCPVVCAGAGNSIRTMQGIATREWPDIVMAGRDEPTPDTIDEVVRARFDADQFGLRVSSAVASYNLTATANHDQLGKVVIGDLIDDWVISASTWDDNIVKKGLAEGKTIGAYWCLPNLDSDADRIRYLVGLWAWKTKPRCLLLWAYVHVSTTRLLPNGELQRAPVDEFSYVIPTVNGPQETPGYAAYAEGIKDCRALEALEAAGTDDDWLCSLRASISERVPSWPVPVSRTDFDTIRARALRVDEPVEEIKEDNRDSEFPERGSFGRSSF
jgi:hypothetical protein